MSYRLLACDIDNTLVRFPDPPSPRVERALRAAAGLGVTVYFGQRKGSASTSDLSPQAIRETVEAALAWRSSTWWIART
ncbi:MAG: hypothetical protein P8049_12170 [Gemmatimonadota bacterium]